MLARIGACCALLGALAHAQSPVARIDAGDATIPVTSFSKQGFLQNFSDFSGLREPELLVVRDSASWRQTWTRVNQPFIPQPPLPPIDFTREMVIVAAMGTQPTSASGIRIDAALSDGSRLRVEIQRRESANTCRTQSVKSQPVDIVRLPASNLPVQFVERTTIPDCSPLAALRR
jgi:hypothetical protein